MQSSADKRNDRNVQLEPFTVLATSNQERPESICWWKCYGKGKDSAGIRAYVHLSGCVIALLLSVFFEMREDRTDLCAGQRLIRHAGRKVKNFFDALRSKSPAFAKGWGRFFGNYPGNRPWYADAPGIFSHVILILVFLVCLGFLAAAIYYGL